MSHWLDISEMGALMIKKPVQWFQVKSVEQISALEDHLRAIAPFTAYTTGVRDKFNKPICFLGTRVNGAGVDGHAAVWFKSEELESAGMKVIQKFAIA